MKKYFDENYDGHPYDAISIRKQAGFQAKKYKGRFLSSKKKRVQAKSVKAYSEAGEKLPHELMEYLKSISENINTNIEISPQL